jgi:hypothetical protein
MIRSYRHPMRSRISRINSHCFFRSERSSPERKGLPGNPDLQFRQPSSISAFRVGVRASRNESLGCKVHQRTKGGKTGLTDQKILHWARKLLQAIAQKFGQVRCIAALDQLCIKITRRDRQASVKVDTHVSLRHRDRNCCRYWLR